MAPATVPVAIQGPRGAKAILADKTASFTEAILHRWTFYAGLSSATALSDSAKARKVLPEDFRLLAGIVVWVLLKQRDHRCCKQSWRARQAPILLIQPFTLLARGPQSLSEHNP